MKKQQTKRGKVDWDALELEFIMSSLTLHEFADAHMINRSTVQNQAAKRNWVDKRDKKRQETTKHAESIATDDRIAQQAAQNRADLTIAQELMAKVQDMFLIAERPQDLKALSGAAKDAQAIARLALGMTTGNTGISDPDGNELVFGLRDVGLDRKRDVLAEALKSINER